MADDSDSKDKKNLEEKNEPQPKKEETKKSSKSAPKKKKRTKDPNRHIADLAKKYSRLSQQFSPFEELMKKASLAHDLERQMGSTYNVMRVMEERMRISDQINSIAVIDMPDIASFNTIGEAARLATERTRDFFDNIAKFSMDQIGRYQEMIHNYDYFTPLRDVIQTFSEKHAWLDALKVNPIEAVFRDIEGIQDITFKDIFKISSEMKDFYSNLPDDDIKLKNDETIECDGNTYDISEIQGLIEETVEKSEFSEDNKITKEDFERLIKEIRKIKDTCLQKILWNFFVPLILLIIAFLLNWYSYDSKAFISKHRTEIIKIIEQEITEKVVDRSELKEYRLVTRQVLEVRERNYGRSRLIWKLYIGSIVKVIQKKNDWTLIEWEHKDNDLIIKGWVFSRYLKKIEFDRARKQTSKRNAKDKKETNQLYQST